MTLTEHVDRFLSDYATTRGASEHTLRAYSGDLAEFAAFLESRHVDDVTLVTPRTLRGYLASLEERGLSAVVRATDAESYRPKSKPDVVVLDPPRTGAPGAIQRIVVARIPEVVYVSCDPPTLSRDLKTLAEAGYRLTDAIAFDMFPQTAHVECVVRVVRSD